MLRKAEEKRKHEQLAGQAAGDDLDSTDDTNGGGDELSKDIEGLGRILRGITQCVLRIQ